MYRAHSPKHCDVIKAFVDILRRKFGCDVTQCLQQVTPDFETRLKQDVNSADYILVVLQDQRYGELLNPDAFDRYCHGLLDLIDHPDDHPICPPLRDRVVLIRFPYTPEYSQLTSLAFAVRFCVPEQMSHLYGHLTKRVTSPFRYGDSWLTEESGQSLTSAVEGVAHGYHIYSEYNLSQNRVDNVTPPQDPVQLSYQWETGSSTAQPLTLEVHPQGLWPPDPPSITTPEADEILKAINKEALEAFFS